MTESPTFLRVPRTKNVADDILQVVQAFVDATESPGVVDCTRNWYAVTDPLAELRGHLAKSEPGEGLYGVRVTHHLGQSIGVKAPPDTGQQIYVILRVGPSDVVGVLDHERTEESRSTSFLTASLLASPGSWLLSGSISPPWFLLGLGAVPGFLPSRVQNGAFTGLLMVGDICILEKTDAFPGRGSRCQLVTAMGCIPGRHYARKNDLLRLLASAVSRGPRSVLETFGISTPEENLTTLGEYLAIPRVGNKVALRILRGGQEQEVLR